jgi:hypothetical protein
MVQKAAHTEQADEVQQDDIQETLDLDSTDEAVEEATEDAAETVVEDEVDSEGGEADEMVITLGDAVEPSEEDEKSAPDWVRNLRKSNRDKDRRIRELEQKVTATAPVVPAVVLGPKPTFESSEYDEEKFTANLEDWHKRKLEVEEQQRAKERAAQEDRGRWQGRMDAVTKASTAMPVRDYEDAAGVFEDTFSVVQQGIIIGGPDDPKVSAQLRYALGKNPKKAKELAAISDPVKFTLAIGDLMTKLKVTTRKAAPVPERVVRSSVSGAAAVDNQLNRLREEAAKTGNYSKVHQYRQQIREKSKA